MTRDYLALLRFIAERRDMPFAWGSEANDCASYGNAAAKALTGRDVLAEMGLSWATEAEARALLAVEPLDARLDRHLSPVAPAMARRGDLGAVPHADGVLIVVVEGATVVGPDVKGERRLPRRMMTKAWSLG